MRSASWFAQLQLLTAAVVLLHSSGGCSSNTDRAVAVSGSGPPPEMHVPASRPGPLSADSTQSLFDGSTLDGWNVLKESVFEKAGRVHVEDGRIVLERGNRQTGIAWRGDFPRDNYEVSLEAMRVTGSDFFCGMTFPVASEPCTLIVGGWGGMVVGLSNVDGNHAAENVTTTGMNFNEGEWYAIRLRVTPERIVVWINDREMVNLERAGHQFGVWFEQELCQPFGFSTWETGAALRNIQVRRIAG